MTYILYQIARRMPRPLLVALVIVLMSGLARAQEVCEKSQFLRGQRPPGLKPALILCDFRRPKGPLFHGCAIFYEFF